MASWFECKVRYDKIQENGAVKKVTDTFLADSLSITEAVARITKEQAPFISGDFVVSSAKSTKIAEIFRDDSADKWYLVKVAFITIDEKTGVEKKASTLMLVQAAGFKDAMEHFLAGMKGTMADFEIQAITETPILDCYKVKGMAETKEEK